MDMIDEAQQLADDNRADALAAHRLTAGGAPGSGICRDCGDPIDADRLAALPTATRCIDCQLRHERTAR